MQLVTGHSRKSTQKPASKLATNCSSFAAARDSHIKRGQMSAFHKRKLTAVNVIDASIAKKTIKYGNSKPQFTPPASPNETHLCCLPVKADIAPCTIPSIRTHE